MKYASQQKSDNEQISQDEYIDITDGLMEVRSKQDRSLTFVDRCETEECLLTDKQNTSMANEDHECSGKLRKCNPAEDQLLINDNDKLFSLPNIYDRAESFNYFNEKSNGPFRLVTVSNFGTGWQFTCSFR